MSPPRPFVFILSTSAEMISITHNSEMRVQWVHLNIGLRGDENELECWRATVAIPAKLSRYMCKTLRVAGGCERCRMLRGMRVGGVDQNSEIQVRGL